MTPYRKPSSRNAQPNIRRAPSNTYYRAESKPSSSPFTKKPPARPARIFVLGFLDTIIVVVLLLIVLYALALKSNPVVDANDFSYHSQSVYVAAAHAQFSSFENRNKVTFNETAVVKSLEAKFPEVSSAQIELPLFSERPVVHLLVAKPSFVLVSHVTPLVVDSEGIAVGPESTLDIKDLPVIEDQSGYMAKAGNQVLSADSVVFIDTLIAECQRAKVPIASLILPAEPQELQLHTKDSDYYVKFYLGGSVLQETGQFLAARQHFSQTHQPPSEYLDVRVPGKIFYK